MSETGSDTTTLTLPTDLEIVITRVFDAPRELVFDAWTKPEHVKHWYGLRGSTVPVCEIDLRPGGTWRYLTREADGQENGFSGVYREIVRPERLVYTWVWEPMPDHPHVETLTFEEHDGKTTLTGTSVFPSVEDRDGLLNSGMEGGMRQTLDRLAEHLGTMA